MKLRRDIVFVVLAIFCLTATLFMVKPTRSQSANEYSPWIDLNDDGKINIIDIVQIALAFGTEGNPINKTALLLELQNRVAELEDKVGYLELYHPKPSYPDWFNGLVGYWRLDEGTGAVAGDSSGKNNNGTLYGPTWVDGKYGKALDFDGVNDWVEVPKSSSLDIVNGVSVAVWIYPKASPASGVILGRWYDETEPDRGIVFQLISESFHFGVIDDNNRLLVPFTFEMNKWYYLAATWNGSVSRVYVNGVEVGNRSTSGSFTNQNMNLGIGSDINPPANRFNGTIDEVTVYNRALSQEEIIGHYIYPPP